MPIYQQCPYCEHPRVVPATRQGRVIICRQCGHRYMAAAPHDEAVNPRKPSSRHRLRPQEPVYVLSA